MEERISFPAGAEVIEGLLELNSLVGGIVITHPHLLYGGDMDNPVVEAIARPCRAKGYSILKFNFRGVGNSTGRYDNGIGEQEDVQGAIKYLQARGIENVDLAGYSFGTQVNVGAVVSGAPVRRLILVSPPVAVMALGEPEPMPSLKLVITGSRDDIAPPESIRKILPRWNPEAKLEVIEGADHFYTGHLKTIVSVLSPHITTL